MVQALFALFARWIRFSFLFMQKCNCACHCACLPFTGSHCLVVRSRLILPALFLHTPTVNFRLDATSLSLLGTTLRSSDWEESNKSPGFNSSVYGTPLMRLSRNDSRYYTHAQSYLAFIASGDMLVYDFIAAQKQ